MFAETRPVSNEINYILFALLLIISGYSLNSKNFAETIRDTFQLFLVITSALLICVILYRIRLFLEELIFINSEYNGNIKSVIAATMSFNMPSSIVLAIVFFSALSCVINTKLDIGNTIHSNLWATLLTFTSSLLLLYTININECRRLKTEAIFTADGLDAGTAMACSYFYGYLNIILPASGGTERTGMLNLLENFEAAECNGNPNISVPVKKMFILIPSSSYIPTDLKDISDGWLEHSKNLEMIVMDRAGVKKRTYHNTVYKLHTEGPKTRGKSIFLATEGATPLKTFLETKDQSLRYGGIYKEFNREIVRNFYLTLKKLLADNPSCGDYCELVYYEDYIGGKKVNPAHILLKRVKNILLTEANLNKK
ncbi:stimulator of interferon genes protein-like [Trichogramma pretiosum]|uniref:stimulator of interferon genes protein-like n=1 Tax=Trichogramma pretiosum TaxID=7493 RepID=UPI0006C9585F|nr:stimulator of interferon genes protein-like [Trichogramma pretiosum]